MGKLLCFSRESILPDRCLKCNLPADGWRLSRKLSWHSPAYYLVLLISPILYILVALLVRWTAKVDFPVCEEHLRRRRNAIIIGWVAALVGMGLIGTGIFLSDNETEALLLPFFFVGGFAALLGGLLYGVIGSRIASVNRIDHNWIYLSGVNPEFLDSLNSI